MQEAISYRSFFNRSRSVLFLHPRPIEVTDLREVFHAQGFITNIALNLRVLIEIISDQAPDAIVAYAEHGECPVQVATIRSLAPMCRLYLVTDDIPALADVVRSVRSGALAVFAHPLQVTEVLREVESDLASDLRLTTSGRVQIAGMGSLSEREREVLDLILQGRSNKDAGITLKISPRTVGVHRAHVMKKLGARNTAEMVRIALGR